jgi:large subunit ribosomal protein L21
LAGGFSAKATQQMRALLPPLPHGFGEFVSPPEHVPNGAAAHDPNGDCPPGGQSQRDGNQQRSSGEPGGQFQHFAHVWLDVNGCNTFTPKQFGLYTIPFAQVPNMYAIVQSAGRQVKVTPGGYVLVDGTIGEPGAELTLESVLLVEKDGGEILAGAPYVANAKIVAVVEGEARGPKIRVFKKKRRKGMRRTKGHRSTYTRLKVKDIIL